MKIFLLTFLILFWSNLSFASNLPAYQFPVVYILYGEIPSFLRVNIELASRRNPVILISDGVDPWINTTIGSRRKVVFEPLKDYYDSAARFAPNYKHLMPRSHGAVRRTFELKCIQRWFILHEYMRKRGVERVLFSDGDSAVFANVENAWALRSKDCDAVINIETQAHTYHWVGAGESSLWTVASLADLCAFIDVVYVKHSHILEAKFKAGSNGSYASFLC